MAGWVPMAGGTPRGGGGSNAGSVPQFQRCLAEVDALLRQRLASGESWSDVPTSDLESRYIPVTLPLGPAGPAVAAAVLSLVQHQRL